MAEEIEALKEQLDRIERLLIESSKTILNIDECAAYTGYSKDTIYRHTSQRTIPFYKPMNGAIYFRRSEIDDWLLRNRMATKQEISSMAATHIATRRVK